MNILARILREVLDLFVDDGTLALLLVLWTIAIGLAAPLSAAMTDIGGPLLLTGYVVILFENVCRYARRATIDKGDGNEE